MAREFAHRFDCKAAGSLRSLQGDHGIAPRNSLCLIADFRLAAHVEGKIGAGLASDLIDRGRRGSIRLPEKRQRTIMQAIGIALLQGKWDRRTKKPAITLLFPDLAGLEHPLPVRMGTFNGTTLLREQVASVLHELEIEWRQVLRCPICRADITKAVAIRMKGLSAFRCQHKSSLEARSRWQSTDWLCIGRGEEHRKRLQTLKR